MFIILVKYVKPLEVVDEHLIAHRTYLKECYDRKELICSGRRKSRVGGIILANVESEEKVWELIKQDPFYTSGVAEFEVLEFTPTLFDERFACFVSQ